MTTTIDTILSHYTQLLTAVDQWFCHSQVTFPDQIRCGQACSGCCRGLFDVTLLDAWLVRRGYEQLTVANQKMIRVQAEARLTAMRSLWPEFAEPYILNYRPDTEWEPLMPDEDETTCVFLDDTGCCLIYAHRPMTCRLHGLPLIDTSGEIMHDEWCTENFPSTDPLHLHQLQAPFDEWFRAEVALMQQLTGHLFGEELGELDTFIPLAALVNYDWFDWGEWWNRIRLIPNEPV